VGRPSDERISLVELDARHDDVLCRLEELDERIKTVLREYLPQKTAGSLLTAGDSVLAPLPMEAQDLSLDQSVVTCGGPNVLIC
jgi:hypothetical protein